MKKLLRPLHRQRVKRRSRARVLNTQELTKEFGLDQTLSDNELETYLRAHNIAYHKDSTGTLWASIAD